MKKNSLRIGNLTFEYPFVLAPLAGITDRSMRSLCSQAGASLTFTEMVSAKGLWYGDRKTGELLKTGWTGDLKRSGSTDGCAAGCGAPAGAAIPQEGPVGFQLFGSEPTILEYAVRLLSDPDHAKAVDAQMAALMEENAAGAAELGLRPPMGARTAQGLEPPALFDLNAGCPVPKIVRNGEGSALLKNPDLLYDCVAAMVRGAKAACMDAVARADAVPGTAAVYGTNASSEMNAMPGTNAADGLNAVAGRSATVRLGATAETNAAVKPDAAAGVRSPLPVTVKIRKGFERDDDCAVEIAKAAEAAGAAAVTVHGRTRAQFYEGRADWDVIARVKAAVKIPVIGNGDITCGADAIRMMEETGCDGVMIARGALGNPWIFRDARALWDGQACPPAPEVGERIDQLLRHIDLVREEKGEAICVREMRKHVGWYIKGIRGSAQVRRRINTAGSIEEMKQILQEL